MMDAPDNQDLYAKIHAYSVGLLEDALTPVDLREFERLLLENPAAVSVYVQYMQESASLRWLCVEGGTPGDAVMLRPRATDGRGWRRVVAVASSILAVTIAVVAVGLQLWNRSSGRPANEANDAAMGIAAAPASGAGRIQKTPTTVPNKPVSGSAAVATITGLDDARWSASPNGGVLLSRCGIGDRLVLESGSAVFTFDAGAQLTAFGPADFEITSATSIRCRSGRVTALVDHRGKGFFIETPQAKVVDIGTQFGLSVSDEGETEVVVFQGSVDLSYHPQAAAGDTSTRRMEQGEALLLKNSGEFQRVVSVQRNSFLGFAPGVPRLPREPVIGELQDNIRTDQSMKSYQIVHGGLEEDAPAFVDRLHQWNGLDAAGLPEFLRGADYIMPFNDDKFIAGLEIEVRLLRPATLYVFLDNNMAVPGWLQEDFTDTGVDIGLDGSSTEWHRSHALDRGPGRSIDVRFSVWKREILQAGTVKLRGIEEAPQIRSHGFNMYGVAAAPKD